MPIQHVIVCAEQRFPLPEEVTVIGRGIACGIRFNTATVSRQHIKLIVAGDRLSAENLSTTTGTRINGKRFTDSVRLHNGDKLLVGPHLVVIEAEEVTRDIPPGGKAAAPLHFEPDDDEDEVTRGEVNPDRISLRSLAAELPEIPSIPSINTHTCPECRARVPFAESECSSCGHSWGPSHPSSITGKVTISDLRAHLKPEIARPVALLEIPVIYSSDEMTLDVTVGDIRADGMFIPTELLDPARTVCELTVLPDGHPVVTFRGVVKQVRAAADANGPAGLFIEFTEIPADSAQWLARRAR